jgi:hypothetical protein
MSILAAIALQLGGAPSSPIPPAPPPPSHYDGGRDLITSSAAVTCPRGRRYSAALHQRTGQPIVVDALVSDGRRLPRSQVEPVERALAGTVLEYATIGCASWTQAIVDVAVNRRAGDSIESVYVPVFLEPGTAHAATDWIRKRQP